VNYPGTGLQSRLDAHPSASEHLVLFYEEDNFLLNSVCGFASTGLRAGETVIVFTTSDHRDRLEQLLVAEGFDLTAARAGLRFVPLDPAEILSKILVGGYPDQKLFFQFVEGILASYSNGRRVRIFGEMVAALCNEGNQNAAVRLEELWNIVGRERSFSLLCAYPIGAFEGGSQNALDQVCSLHSSVILFQHSFSSTVALLEERALALQSEITKREEAESALRQLKDELETQVEDLRCMHEMSVRLTQTLDIDMVLQEVLRAALDVQGTDLGLLTLCGPERSGLNLRVSSGFKEEFLKLVEWIAPGAPACGTCYSERRRVIVEDSEKDPLFAPAARVGGFRSCHSTPLISRTGNMSGVLTVCFRQPYRPTEREIRLMDVYARMASDFIENARLHHQMQQELAEREQLLLREQLARSEAERANRMKDEFLATVSHELRTPLNSIIGWCHALRTGKIDEPTQSRALESIERNARVQAQLIEDILDVSRVITGKLRLNIGPVDLSLVINLAIDSVQLAASSKDLDLKVTLDPSIRHMVGDSGRLQQVIWNLLSNAIKFTPVGGSVEVRLRRAGSDAQISVIDTGQGINPAFLPFVFDRFRQADATITRRHGGLGLGLAIVRHLVELHGGTVGVFSAGDGRGAEFTIRVPLTATSERLKTRAWEQTSWRNADEAFHRYSLEGRRILLVDDDQDTLSMLTELLSRLRAGVQSASSVAEALEILKWYEPDVLVSDIAMPDEDGYALIAKVRALESGGRKSIHAVALTALVRIEDRTRVLSAGFNMFVPKPVEPDELIPAIANLV
jgi:signal transduction histidine kinase